MPWTAGTLSGATHHFLSLKNQNPWAMPWEASSNPPGCRRRLLFKPSPLAPVLIPAGCWQDTEVWEPASLPGLARKLQAQEAACARTTRASTAGSFPSLFRTDVEHSSGQKQKKRRTHTYCPKRSNSALPEHTFWGQGGRGPSCYLRPVMLKHSQRH